MRLDWIIIDELFEGTPAEFADCFFSNVNTESVLDFCQSNGLPCELRFEPS